MAKFESGVKGYVPSLALVTNYFPIDYNGREYCCCEECFFYREASKTCGLNHQPILFPGKYVGQECPLHKVTEKQVEQIYDAFEKIITEGDVKDEKG